MTMKRKKKPLMKIGMAGKNVTYGGNYNVNWGKTGKAYNKQVKSFKTRKKAIAFKNKLVRKFKPRNRIQYMYIAD